MRRLVSKEEEQKNKKKNQIIVGVVLVVLMIFSTLGFAIQSSLGNSGTSDSGSTLKYNGFEFSSVNGLWVLGNYVFKYSPQETNGNVSGSLNGFQSYSGLPLYFNSENEDAAAEIQINLGQIVQRTQEACLQGQKNCAAELPIKDCTDNFIIIKESNNSGIKQEDKCVYIDGQYSELPQLTDEFLYRIFGIKN